MSSQSLKIMINNSEKVQNTLSETKCAKKSIDTFIPYDIDIGYLFLRQSLWSKVNIRVKKYAK